jgi:Crp-like helix-turn-helix domain
MTSSYALLPAPYMSFWGAMLGTPRTTLTLAAGSLHDAGLIDYSHGHVTIRNRSKLEGSARECYRVVRSEFDRLGLL